jgi:3'-phosphoadenosine 5'-phosphosulfate sulfotransferase
MEPIVPPKEELKKDSPEIIQKQLLDNHYRKLEIKEKMGRMKVDKILNELEIEQARIRLQKIKENEDGFLPPIISLLEVANAYCVDNSGLAIGSETKFKSIWEDEEMGEIKKLIMRKARRL